VSRSHRWVTGRRAVAEAVRAGLADEVVVGTWVRTTPGLRDVLRAARDADVPVREAPRSTLDGIDPEHQGVAARIAAPRELNEVQLAEHPFGAEDVVVILDGITDPQNLGAAARSAEAAGVAMLVTRIRRSAGLTPAAVRASAGALSHLPVARVTNLRRTLDAMKGRGFTVVGLDAEGRSIAEEPCPDGPVAVVVGAEGTGISHLVREGCDLLVSLPMRGRVGSLNASAALAAALYAYVLPSREWQG
jgi:23S rRNA (guanosine2251-2'-O)-methyltransferase